jgi:uncharacterized PurR-regulated membrane protein YhhQ (DUF165 family)
MVRWDPNHKFLALRTIASTVAGEFADSCIFITGAFIGLLPWSVVFTMVFVQWGIKCLVEFVMTPLTMIICKALKKAEEIDVVGTDTYNPFKVGKA